VKRVLDNREARKKLILRTVTAREERK